MKSTLKIIMRYFKPESMIIFNQRFHPDRSGQVVTLKN
jgi:hypothetical protein